MTSLKAMGQRVNSFKGWRTSITQEIDEHLVEREKLKNIERLAGMFR